MQTKSTFLKTENLSIGYPNQVVAKNISLDLKEGQIIALVGSNGIGKSTLLRTLTQMQPPLEGQIFLQQKNLQSFHVSELAKQVSVVLTTQLPPSNLSVYELIALGRQPYTNWLGSLSEVDKKAIQHAIEMTEVTDLLQKKHYEISDGQLQSVLIARALAQDTPFIVLDEPTTHLDLLHKVSLLKLLKKLSVETQKTLLYSTHDIDLAIQLSDEMIVMLPEQTFQNAPCVLIEQGVFNQLFNNPDIFFDAQKGKFIVQ